MKYSVLVLFSFFLCLFVQAQKEISSPVFPGTWVQDSANFPDNIVNLKPLANADSTHYYTRYNFLENGTVKLISHAPRGRAMCGNGIPSLKKGTWTYAKGELRISLSGTYLAAGTFDYDLSYTVELRPNGKLVLKKSKTFKNAFCETCIGK